MTGGVAFAVGIVSIGERGITEFGVVTIGGSMGGVEALYTSGGIGVVEGCTFGAGTGAT